MERYTKGTRRNSKRTKKTFVMSFLCVPVSPLVFRSRSCLLIAFAGPCHPAGGHEFTDNVGGWRVTHDIHSNQHAFCDLQWSLLCLVCLVPDLHLRALFSQEAYD